MSLLETRISNLVQYHFPGFYREDGPVFIEFVKTYYEWMEQSNNTLFYARSLPSIHDIDTTTSQFLIYFKEKYLKNIQFDTASQIKETVKHSLDLYRSKGTDRAIDLFFKIVFGSAAEVYYPGNDIFRLSNGVWRQPTYLEVVRDRLNAKYVGLEIEGIDSGAKAFVESYVQRKSSGRPVNVFYISAISGEFQTGEQIFAINDPTLSRITIIGSLTSASILFGGNGYKIGDIVKLTSSAGFGGYGRVNQLADLAGIVTYNFIDGGYGYTSSANVLVSESVITVDSYNSKNPDGTDYWYSIRSLTQPMANLHYEFATGPFVVNDVIYTTAANGMVTSNGIVMSVTAANSTSGTLLVSQRSGNLASNVVFHSQSGYTANLFAGGYTDKTATADLIAASSNVNISFTSQTGSITNGSEIYQLNPNTSIEIANGLVTSIRTNGSFGDLTLANTNGIFTSNNTLRVRGSNTRALSANLSIQFGVIYSSGTFSPLVNNLIRESQSNSCGTVTSITQGAGASANISPILSFTESILFNTDVLRDYLTVPLNALTYGANLHTANGTNAITLLTALNFPSFTIGTMTGLINENPGSNYNYPPFIRVIEPFIDGFKLRDYDFTIANTTAQYKIGELITQNATGARALVYEANTTYISAKRLNFNDVWVSGNLGSTYDVVGESSGARSQLSHKSQKTSGKHIGFNAIVTTNTSISNSSVSDMTIVDSGFGYNEDSDITFTKEGNNISAGLVRGHRGKHGISLGYYASDKGFLSANKYLYDAYYYQDFSYEVRSSITLDKYEDMLKKLLHVAGTKVFGSVINISPIDASDFNITVETSIDIAQPSSSMLGVSAGGSAGNLAVTIFEPSLDFEFPINSSYIATIGV